MERKQMKINITPLRRILEINDGPTMLNLGFSKDSTSSLVGPAMLSSGCVWQQNLELRERKEKEHLRERKRRRRGRGST